MNIASLTLVLLTLAQSSTSFAWYHYCEAKCTRSYNKVLFREHQPKYPEQFDISCRNAGGTVTSGSYENLGGQNCGGSSWRVCIQQGQLSQAKNVQRGDSEYNARQNSIDACFQTLSSNEELSCSSHISVNQPKVDSVTCTEGA
jgi:hypothetical protein